MSRTITCALLAALVAAGGCQTYEKRPVDLAGHDARWAGLLDDHEGLEHFARYLDGSEASAPDPSDGITLREARVVTLVGNTDLRRARLAAGVPAASAEFAGRWDDPVFDLGVMRNIDTGSDPWILGGSLGFTIPLSGRLGVERRQAWAQADAAQREAAVQEWLALRELGRQWIAWSATRLKAEAVRSYLQELDALVEMASQLAEAGEAAPTDARLLQIERVQRRVELATLEASATQQRLGLLALMGLRPNIAVELVPALPDADTAVSMEDAWASIETLNPPLLAKLAAYDAAELELEREIRKQYPDLTIGPAYGNEDGQSRIGLGLSIPLPVLNRNQRGIAEAAAKRELARAEVESAYQDAITQLASASARLETARSLRDATLNELAPLVEEQVREVRGLIELGEIDALLLKDALEAVVSARLAVIDARAEEADAAWSLRSLIEPELIQQGLPQEEAE